MTAASSTFGGTPYTRYEAMFEGLTSNNRAFRDLIRAEFQSKPPRASFTGSYPAACGEKAGGEPWPPPSPLRPRVVVSPP